MYDEFFGLQHPPFENAPNPALHVPLAAQQAALDALLDAVAKRRGLVLLTGAPGTGKTLLTRVLRHRLGPDAAVGILAGPCESPDDLCVSVADAFRLRPAPENGVRRPSREIERLARELYEQDVPAVLVVDGAHELSDSCFDLVRRMASLEADDMPLIQIILVGWPKVRARFTGLAGTAVQQRVYRHIELAPLSAEETLAYIDARLRAAGLAEPAIFDAEAAHAVHARTGGIPRLVNLLCDRLLAKAAESLRATVSADDVRSIDFPQEYNEELYAAQMAGDEGPEILSAQLDRHPVVRQILDRLGTVERDVAHAASSARESLDQHALTERQVRRYGRLFDRLLPLLRTLRQFRLDSEAVLDDCRTACRRMEELLARPEAVLAETRALAGEMGALSAHLDTTRDDFRQAQTALAGQIEAARQSARTLAEQVAAATPTIDRTRLLVGTMRKINSLTQDRCHELAAICERAGQLNESLPQRLDHVEKSLREPSRTLERLNTLNGILRERMASAEAIVDRVRRTVNELRAVLERQAQYHSLEAAGGEDFGGHESLRRPAAAVPTSFEPENLARRVQELRNLVQNTRRQPAPPAIAR